MSNEHRSEIIEYLLTWSNWSSEKLDKLSNRKLLEEYDRHLKMG